MQKLFIFLLLLQYALLGMSAQQLYNHGNPSAQEQYMLELLNRARLDPQGEADLYLGGNLNEGLSTGTISTDAKQPLTFNTYLLTAAEDHTRWMLDNNTFSHTGAGGSSPADRVSAAGYSWNGVGENIAWKGSSSIYYSVQTFITDIHEDLFVDSGISGRGHRINMMSASFKEVGIGIIQDYYTPSSSAYYTVMVTQDFAYSSSSPEQAPGSTFLLGVVYEDANGNNFYDIGEGLANIEVRPNEGDFYAMTSASGGYAIPLLNTINNSIEVTFSGASLTGTITKTIDISSGTNVKLDALSSEAVVSDTDSDNDGIPDTLDPNPTTSSDFDGDGNNDADDLNVIYANYGANAASLSGSEQNADMDGDGMIDYDDIWLWYAEYLAQQ